jgi:predicted nucleic acid-binding protein
MALPILDTNIIVSFLSGDNPQQQERAERLLKQVEAGKLTVTAPDTVIADAVYILFSKKLYNLPAATIAQLLLPVVRLPHFRLKNRKVVIAALKLFAEGIKFDDTMIIATMRQSGATLIYTFDRGFDEVPGITRRELYTTDVREPQTEEQQAA